MVGQSYNMGMGGTGVGPDVCLGFFCDSFRIREMKKSQIPSFKKKKTLKSFFEGERQSVSEGKGRERGQPRI